ncbi:anhydro-N-acetylmuramic acid kinase [Sphingobacterium sp. LRF_L2]|uniref:anhydro-N-acetylmuramic acid kinase n=1 Tax=Sphingobacterium sp. LRF_L2 TaxID=3369421 RepID=UPI003F61933E
MNPLIQRLYQIAKKDNRRIIGLMSGTSLDGLDIALCHITNSGSNTSLYLEKFITLPYEDIFRQEIRQIFAKREIDQQTLSGLNVYVAQTHAQLVNQALKQWQINPDQIDIIASHGQTVYHAPQRLTKDLHLPNSTLQIGDGDHIAVMTGIITLSDFRQKHIATGGEGAPLAAYGDYLLFRDKIENRFLLNIGGISNFTFLPKSGSARKAYATDIGPGNTMMNQYMFENSGLEMDKDATMAKMGTVNQSLLATLLSHSFFKESFPKTTGPELFSLSYLKQALKSVNCKELSCHDIMATLNKFSAESIIKAIKEQAKSLDDVAIYVSGGGLHNPLLMQHIKDGLSEEIKVTSFYDLNLNPDAKEACLFAILANETLSGEKENVRNLSDSPAVCMGKISLPY